MLEPVEIAERLEAIERDLEKRQTPLAEAADKFYKAKRDLEEARANSFISTKGSVEQRKAQSIVDTTDQGKVEEAEFEARKRAIMVLETRASILQTLAKVGR